MNYEPQSFDAAAFVMCDGVRIMLCRGLSSYRFLRQNPITIQKSGIMGGLLPLGMLFMVYGRAGVLFRKVGIINRGDDA